MKRIFTIIFYSFTVTIDNINWQRSSQFTMENGSYTIYVETKAGCLIDQRNISIFETKVNGIFE